MASVWNIGRQLLILLWKNFLLQLRRPIGTLVELLVPPAACVVVIILRFSLFELENRCHLTFDPDPLTLPVPHNPYHIYYTPNTSQHAREVADYLRNQEFYWSVIGVSTEQEMVDRLTSLSPPLPPIELTDEFGGINVTQHLGCFVGGAGIVFDSLEGDDLEYTLRLRHEVGETDTWHTGEAAFWFQYPGARVTDNSYLAEGFLHLQNRVAEALVNWKAQQANLTVPHVQVSVKQIPYPSYRIDRFLNWNAAILPLLLIMAFIYSAGMFTKELVLEKETRIRESMFMMGLKQWVLWTTWFVKQFIFLLASSVVITLLLKVGQVFPESNVFLLLLFFILFATASISWGFFVSVWFTSARLGMVVSFVAWFFIYTPFFYVPQYFHRFTLPMKLAMCVLTNTCMGLGVTLVSEWEVRQQGLTTATLLQPLTIEDGFHMGWVMIMLFIDTVLFLVLAWYVNGVKPGRYGVPRPFYFPFQPSYWTGKPCRTAERNVESTVEGVYDRDLHEEVPDDLKEGISIQNLLKIYDDDNKLRRLCNKTDDEESRRKVAVDGLSLNMYEGQITALLGHNGAGKTTTISILTGLYTPTSGTAVINDYDIRTNMDQIRQSLGICPQHNVLFDRLTVLEHLKFFARLKGLQGKEVQKAADDMIKDLQLEDKRNIPSQKLSGGMKRKLSVGIALIGGSKIVVLDEPTSGMDPYARRATWDLLAKHKEGRTMLLTTHFMDEADLLGDRIAIMAEGKLRCSGSSLFLKSRYGVGYHMVIVKEPSCDSTKVCDLVLGKVPGSQVVTDVGAELSFILPSTATHHFPSLFDTLEADQRDLGVSSYGISVTTMEEVFMKVREGAEETLRDRVERSARAASLSPTKLPPTVPPSSQLPPPSQSSQLSPPSQSSLLSLHSMPHGTVTRQFENVKKEETSLALVDVNISQSEPQLHVHEDFKERYPNRHGMSWSHVNVKGDGVSSENVHYGGSAHVEMRESERESTRGLKIEIQGVCVGESDDDVEDGCADLKYGLGAGSEENQSLPLSQTSERTSSPSPLALNTGLTAWLQKYRAMVVKRMYTSFRFWQAMISHLVLPLTHVIYAMVLASTLLFNDNPSDPKRSLSLSKSALSDNRTLFWAEFHDGVVNGDVTGNMSSFFDFQSLTAGSLDATNLYDYTGRVLKLVNTSVQSGRDTEQCCGYRFQMLDKYCSSRTVEELREICSHKSSFPYHHCKQCLSCCISRITRLPSCTHPLTQNTKYEEDEFCPSPPQTSIHDLVNNSTVGPLDTYTAYVDDILLRLSHNITGPVFTRRVVGGFALQHKRDPPYTVCACNTTDVVCNRTLQLCQHSDGQPTYIAPSLTGVNGSCLNTDFTNVIGGSGESGSEENGSGKGQSDLTEQMGCGSVELLPGYVVDGLSADLLQTGACACDGSECKTEREECLVSTQYHQETTETLSVTVWYNNRPWHMSAASLNAFHNVWLRQATRNSNLKLNVNNHPLPRTSLNNLADAQQANLDGYYVGITVVFGYSFLVASFVLVLVAERESKAKHLQFVSGGEVTSFWLANFTWDLINSLLPVTVSVIIFALFQLEAYSGIALLAVAFLLLLTCWSSIPLVYCLSFLFSNSLIAFGVIFVVFFLSCLYHALLNLQIFFLTTLVIPDEVVKDSLHYIFLLNPAYALGIGINDIYVNYLLKSICTFTPLAEQSCALNDVYYTDNLFTTRRPGVGLVLVYMAIEGLFLFILTLIIEQKFFGKGLYSVCFKSKRGNEQGTVGAAEMIELHSLGASNPLAIQQVEQDSDVVEEEKKVRNRQMDGSCAIIIDNLIKVYPKSLDGFTMRPAKVAVQGISLAIPTGECFGLLGVNGAGKTTTFNVLIGDISPTSGTAIISGYNIRTELRKHLMDNQVMYILGLVFGVFAGFIIAAFSFILSLSSPVYLVRQLIGYCPQFDALIERMTGRELLTMFARLRGIPERSISQAVEKEITRLDLSKHASKQCGKYSGGNKRKLSTAIALIGDPPIILLDEPTTGMDPATRRYLWDVLTGVTREGRSIVLTSHSMEECEALCTRLAIMVNGQFKCLGSIQHLKNKYGSGYTLQAKVRWDHLSTESTGPLQSISNNSLKIDTHPDNNNGTRSQSEQDVSSGGRFDTTALHKFIGDTFPGAQLLEEHQGAVTYQLCNEALRWATVFREIESHRNQLGIVDYSVSQTTLEQVFVNFAKDQAEEEDRRM